MWASILLNSRHHSDDSQLSGFECELFFSPLGSFRIWSAGIFEISWGAVDGLPPRSSIDSQGKSLSTKKQSLNASLVCPNPENFGVVHKTRVLSVPKHALHFYGVFFAPQQQRTRMDRFARVFFWELNQDETLKQSCLNMLHESIFFSRNYFEGCKNIDVFDLVLQFGKYWQTSLWSRQTKTIAEIFHALSKSRKLRSQSLQRGRAKASVLSVPKHALHFYGFSFAPAAENKDGQIFLRFFWELNQDETLKQSCLNMLHESIFCPEIILKAAKTLMYSILFCNLENTGGHHFEAARPKPLLKSSMLCPNLEKN